jgi:hypothetical protein
MTRTGISIALLSMFIMIALTILFPTVMGIIIFLSVIGVIILANHKNRDHEKVEN